MQLETAGIVLRWASLVTEILTHLLENKVDNLWNYDLVRLKPIFLTTPKLQSLVGTILLQLEAKIYCNCERQLL